MSSAVAAMLFEGEPDCSGVALARPAVIQLEYTLSRFPKSWELDEQEPMLESNGHHEIIVYLESVWTYRA